MNQHYSVEEILGLYHDKDALEIIEDMMEKEIIRSIKQHKENDVYDQELVSASNAGYISGIMWVRGELVKIKEALRHDG